LLQHDDDAAEGADYDDAAEGAHDDDAAEGADYDDAAEGAADYAYDRRKSDRRAGQA